MITTIEESCLTTQLQHCGNVVFELLHNCQESWKTTQIQRFCNVDFELFYNIQNYDYTIEESCLTT